jgi:hypothetical protein
MNKTITLFLLLIIIFSTFVQLIPKVSSQQDYIPSDPYFVGATTYTSNILVIAWVGLDNRINVIHYYALTKT